jgi:alpha-L-fucosidase
MTGKVTKAYLLAEQGKALDVGASGDGVTIRVPEQAPDAIASVVVAEVDGDVQPIVHETVIPQGQDGTITLGAAEAEIAGSTAKVEAGGLNANIGYWTNVHDSVQWLVAVEKPGTFQAEVVQACADQGGSTYTLKAGEKSVRGTVEPTGDWKSYKTVSLGTIEIPQAGKVTVEVKPVKKAGSAIMNLRSVVLKPAK